VSDSSFPDMGEIVKEFLSEARENLQQLDLQLVALENDPANADLIGKVFRALHTTKGAAGVLGFNVVEALAHQGETLLARLRACEIELTEERTTALLDMVDALRELLEHIETHGAEGSARYDHVVERLAGVTGAPAPKLSDPTPITGEGPRSAPEPEVDGSEADVPEEREPPSRSTAPGLEVERARDSAPGLEGGGADVSLERATPSVRVDVSLLDQLMDQVGELVLVRNRIQQLLLMTDADPLLIGVGAELATITGDLQRRVMQTRMLPIGTLWSRLPRMVRSLSLSLGKRVHLTSEGADTELDRAVLEGLTGPLTHLIRNCLDHGIETPAERVAAGKAPVGLLRLQAHHEGGGMVVVVQDDGAGINTDSLLLRAIESGLLSEAEAKALDHAGALQLVFSPGLSTASEVTSFSGRGVGMDVVREELERIGGSVDVHSTSGEGTRFTLRAPLTLAIIPALLVAAGDERFAIPQADLLELVQLDAERAAREIEDLEGTLVFRLRGTLAPLVDLTHVLGLAAQRRPGEADASIVVLQAKGRPYGLLVDEILDTEEVVVKPVGPCLRRLAIYAGATVLGDGRVALILDAAGLARTALLSRATEQAPTARAVPEPVAAHGDQTLILLGSPEGDMLAVPLTSVSRLEEFSLTQVQRAGPRWLAPYRGRLLPLVWVSNLLAGGGAGPIEPPSGTLEVLVCRCEDQEVGLVAGHILDIVENTEGVWGPSTRPGVAASALLAGRVTEILDPQALLAGAELGA
jgi:two-component system, chemotaxis family, sensor kinase CheA